MSDEPLVTDLLESLQSVTDGAVFNIGSSLILKGIKFIIVIVLARFLGAQLYGIFAFCERIVRSLVPFARLGMGLSVIRFMSANRDRTGFQNKVLGFAYIISILTSVILSVSLILFASKINQYTLEQSQFQQTLQIFAISLPFLTIIGISINCYKALELPSLQAVVAILTPLFQLLGISAALLQDYSLLGAVFGFVIGSIVSFVVSIAILLHYTQIRPSWGLDNSSIKNVFNYSIPLTLSKAGKILTSRIDIFMVGIFLSASDVALYNVALVVGGLVIIPLSGFNQIFPPVASKLYSNNNINNLESVYSLTTRWTITASLLISSPLLIYPSEVLSLFGNEFQAGFNVITIFVLGQLINAAAGPSNDLLMMTDHQYAVLFNNGTLGVLNVALNYVLILEYGIVGAALATAGVLAFINIIRVYQVYYFEDLFAYTTAIFKPIIAFMSAASVMLLAKSILSGLDMLVMGSAIGFLIFSFTLYSLGLEPEDRQFVKYYLTNYMS